MIGYLNLFSPPLACLVSFVFLPFFLLSFLPLFFLCELFFCIVCPFAYRIVCLSCTDFEKSTVCVTEINPLSCVCSFPPVYLLALVMPFFLAIQKFINFALLDCQSFPLWFHGFMLCIEKFSAVLRFF